MNPKVIGIGLGGTALVAACAGWLHTSTRLGELAARVERVDALGSVRGDVLTERLSGTEGELHRGELRDTGLSKRVSLVEEGRAMAEDLAVRTDEIQNDMMSAVRALQTADDQNVQLIQTYQQQLDGLQETIDWMSSAWEELPLGTILPWLPPSGEAAPDGWSICNGTNGTPDLRGLFLRGVGDFGEAGLYYQASAMTPAGLHAHDNGSENHHRWGMNWGATRAMGDARAMFDTDLFSESDEVRASHGEHVHQDANLPEHATVLYIIKREHAR